MSSWLFVWIVFVCTICKSGQFNGNGMLLSNIGQNSAYLMVISRRKSRNVFQFVVDIPHANSFHLVWMAFSQIQRIKLYIQWKNSTKRIEECTTTVEIIQNLMLKLCTIWRPRSKIKIALNLIWWVVYVWKRRFGAMHMCRIQYKNRQWKQIKIH